MSKKDQIELLCYSYISSMFAMFHNPRYRGKNFTWDKFPEMCVTHCQEQIFLSLNISPKFEKRYKNIAKAISLEIANRMVKE